MSRATVGVRRLVSTVVLASLVFGPFVAPVLSVPEGPGPSPARAADPTPSAAPPPAPEGGRTLMNNARLEALLRRDVPGLDGSAGRWGAKIDRWQLFVMTDEKHDCMRIMIPVAELTRDSGDLLVQALAANFDRALDARYALHDGKLWAAFLHPLSSLTPEELASALRQVRTLADNTGGSFSSGELIFQGAPRGK